MAMLRRRPNNRRPMMDFVLVGRYESRIGVMVRATAGMGGYDKRHTDAQHPQQ